MEKIEARDFKARCLQLLGEFAASRREPLVVTRHGKPLVMVVPMPPPVKLRRALKGSVLFEHEIVAPVSNNWEARQD